LHPDQAARDWRRCLELSDAYLKNILERAAPHFSPQELLDHLLPDNPSILFAAAAQLFPAADAPQRLPFLAKARRFYETLSGPLQAEDLRQRALVLAGLNQPKEAVASYREALAQKPLQVDWRLDLARLLFEQDQFPEALHELRTILAVQPSNGEAQELLRRTEREIGNIRGK
jgi:predicted Zn-dependent protease